MMSFLDKMIGGMSGTNARYSADIGGALGQLGAGFMAKGVAKENKKTRDMLTKIEKRAVAREMRYEIGLSKVQASVGGGGAYGDAVFRAAETQRVAAERVNSVQLAADFENNLAALDTPSTFSTVAGFFGDVVEARARRSASRARYDGIMDK